MAAIKSATDLNTPANPLVSDIAKPPLDHVKPGTPGWHEMALKPPMAFEPRLTFGCLWVE